MLRLPFLFIATGITGFTLFHLTSLLSLADWIGDPVRGPTGWFNIHLIILGWATMIAMGAVYQLIHVILQSKIFSERLAYVHYGCFTAGVCGLLYGFIKGEVAWIAGFAVLALIGLLLFAFNVIYTLWRAEQWNAITLSTACAVLYLALTGLSGMGMGLNFALNAWSGLHERMFGAHIWLGTLGWFGLLITGFSYKMLPMFYLAHSFPARLSYVTLGLWNAGVLMGAASFLFDWGFWAKWTALLFLVLALLAYNVHLAQIRKHRHKRHPGAGIVWSLNSCRAIALFAISALIYTAFYPQAFGSAELVTAAGWIYLGGWASFMILCYLSKIVPFLWWTQKYGPQVGKPGIPTMAALLGDNGVNLGLTGIAFSLLLLFAGLLFGLPFLTLVGGLGFSLFSLGYISLIALVFTK
ncbi:hypothetical protein [Paenibacillus sp. FSL H8-0537]|uniref:hypothetical protein n=1 Tax=Paenibacillus sp. FSL H8-0537 TaxID=2921399 RepID=UPI003100C4C2